MRIILLIILSTVFALNAIGQNAEQIQKDRNGNVIAIFGNQDSTKKSVIQKGVENLFYIYNIQRADSTSSEIIGSQQGDSNRVFSIIAVDSTSLFQQVSQQGENNRIQIIHVSESDSLDTEENSVKVKQKGDGNRATIIQN